MVFSFQKPENNASRPSAAGGENKTPVTLSGLYTKIEEAQGQIAEYLLRREAETRNAAKAAGAAAEKTSGDAAAVDPRGFSQVLMPVIERLDAIGEMLAQGGGGGGASVSFLEERFNRLEAFFTGNPPELVSRAAEEVREEPAERFPQRAPEHETFSQPARPSGRDTGAWEEAIFGPALAANPSLAARRQSLLQGLARGDANCRYFAGVLMMFQAAAPEKMVLLLKDLGEAYYRWSPKYDINPDAMEIALQEFAERTCEQAGLANAIELVHPGQRFDSGRHNATSRGVEIISVLGWVVLRGNGSVYAKATVDVR